MNLCFAKNDDGNRKRPISSFQKFSRRFFSISLRYTGFENGIKNASFLSHSVAKKISCSSQNSFTVWCAKMFSYDKQLFGSILTYPFLVKITFLTYILFIFALSLRLNRRYPSCENMFHLNAFIAPFDIVYS